MHLNRNEIDKLLRMSHLKIEEAEYPKIQKYLEDLTGWFNTLSVVDVKDEDSYVPEGIPLKQRIEDGEPIKIKDTIKAFREKREKDSLNGCPPYLSVPKIIDDEENKPCLPE